MAARVVILLAFLVGTSEGLLLILVRNVWGHAYSKDHEVVAYLAKMMLILAPSVLFDGLQYVLSGTNTFTMHAQSLVTSPSPGLRFHADILLSDRSYMLAQISLKDKMHVAQIGTSSKVFTCNLQVLLGAADDKRLVLSSTSLHTILLVFLQR
jgi:hypothetical protein